MRKIGQKPICRRRHHRLEQRRSPPIPPPAPESTTFVAVAGARIKRSHNSLLFPSTWSKRGANHQVRFTVSIHICSQECPAQVTVGVLKRKQENPSYSALEASRIWRVLVFCTCQRCSTYRARDGDVGGRR